jgi:membrane-associated PAP2 superfamily phosphatase
LIWFYHVWREFLKHMHTYHMLVKLCCSVSKAYNAMFVGDALILAHLIFTEDLMHHVVKQKTVIVCMAVACSNYPRIILQKKGFAGKNI